MTAFNKRYSIYTISFIILAVYLAIIVPIDARVGYSINVVASDNETGQSSSWSRSQSTSIMQFSATSAISGKGNHTRYTSLEGLAGLGMKETSYGKEGRLIDKSVLRALSDERGITINEEINESDKYSIVINESLPTLIFAQDDMVYKGEGLYATSNYRNNEDQIFANFQAKNFSKAIRYAGLYRNALIFADVTPTRALELALINKSMAFTMSSNSDRMTEFGFTSPDTHVEEVYMGSFKVQKKITKTYGFDIAGIDGECLPCGAYNTTYCAPAAREIFKSFQSQL